MKNYSGTLRIMIRTSAVVSNRESVNALVSYLAYFVGGSLLSVSAIVPVVSGTSGAAADSPMIFLAMVLMFDYFNIQTLLSRTTLIDNSVIGLFPLSGIRSSVFRFVLTLVDKRMFFYLIPALVLAVMLSARGEPAQAAAMFVLYACVYLVASELIFAILPVFRALANRFGVRTAMQLAALPLLLLVFVPGVFRVQHEALIRIPMVSQFVRASHYILASGFASAAAQLVRLLLIGLVLGAALLAVVSLLPAIDVSRLMPPAGTTARSKDKVRSRRHSNPGVGGTRNGGTAGESHVATERSPARAGRRLIFLDWQIRQREEKLLLVILVSPFIGVVLAQAMTHGLHRPIASVILPVFLVTQMIGIPLIERGFTLRGLRLKHVSILPVDPVRFARAKLTSAWLLVVLADLSVTFLLAARWKITYYQGIQGVIYSLFIPFVLILTEAVLIIMFNVISRHALISVLIVLGIEILATFAYVLLMLFSFPLGAAVVAVFFSVAYLLLLPRLGRIMAEEFQTLLEESR